MKNNNTSPKPVVNRIMLMILVVNLIFSGILLYMYQEKSIKTGYVNIGEIYEGFELQVEKKKELEVMSAAFKNTLDSIGLEIKYMENGLLERYDASLAAELEDKKEKFFRLEENFMNELDKTKNTYDQQVWQQINDYTQMYGKENGYDYIFGGNGTGSMMYTKENKDLTKEVLVYVNKKYAGE